MNILHESALHKMIDYSGLIDVLEDAFKEACEVPQRNHYTTGSDGNGLLVMPAWGYRGYIGIKIITLTPSNPGREMPFVQGVYLLFDQKTGIPLLQIDAKALTNYRTAAASALASRYLSNENTSSMLMIGAGSLAPYLVKAHKAVRPISEIYVWSRNQEKAQRLASSMGAVAISRVEDVIGDVDLISSATPSIDPLIRGACLRHGQHIDLVGGYSPEMREADDITIAKSAVFIDTEGALDEAGDIIQPMRSNTITRSDIKGTLHDLVSSKCHGRQDTEAITVFKSTGHAIEDIATAVWLWQGGKSL